MRLTPTVRHRWIRGPGAVGTAALLVALCATPAGAAPSATGAGVGTSPTGVAAARAKLTGHGAAPTRITLVTGDTVTYSRDSAGNTSVTVQPGPGRTDVTFRGSASPDGYYVFPSDAEQLVATGALDRRLFDVRYLVENGYGDTKASQVPVIVQYGQRMAAPTVHKKAEALPASTAPLTLGSINGSAVRVDKKQASSFWKVVRGNGAAGASSDATPGATARTSAAQLGDGLTRVWLDAKVRSFDDVSNPQIGAPIAWAAGYDGTGVTVGVIDTGIDSTHPDLDGKVAASQNFVPAGEPGGGDPSDVTDRFGHGTHVASIIAGTGAASGGRYQGVVPNARLAIAKALSDTGSGADSTIIAAMEWQAATVHARIVSMSLGGGPSDGTDPLSQAVEDLTARYGTLFVIAAGNSGPEAKTVATPGTATSALTVGAVDRADQMAWFSSRGPRLGDGAIKPEIAAPGVNIVAARAKGTSLGAGGSIPGDGPVDDNYTAASGTSMATPHVAGAAAALLQQHPDWTGEQIKDALVGTAKDVGHGVYEQGAGRLDLGRAVTQKVFDDTPSVSASFNFPYTGEPLTRTVTYRNTGDADVTLDLATALVRNGEAVSGIAAVTPATLTVPAGGTASAELTIDPSAARTGEYSGRLTASDAAGDHLAVPIAFRVHPPMHTLRVRVDATSQPVHLATPQNITMGNLGAARINDDDPDLADEPIVNAMPYLDWTVVDERGVFEATMELPEGGVYNVETSATIRDMVDGAERHWLLLRPQVRLDEDTTVTLSLADTTRLDMRTDRPSILSVTNFGYTRTTATGQDLSSFYIYWPIAATPGEFYVSPTQTPTVGSFLAWFNQTRPAAQATVALSGSRRVDLGIAPYSSEYDLVPKFTSDQHLRLVSEAELRAGRDVRGALVVADPAPYSGAEHPTLDRLLSAMDLATQRGAAGVLTDSLYHWILSAPGWTEHMRIPLLWVDQARAATVRAALADPRRPTLDVHTAVDTPYEYHLTHFVHDRIPDTLRFDERTRDLTAVDTTYHAQYGIDFEWGRLPNVTVADATFTPHKTFEILGSHGIVGGTHQVVYYNTTGPDVLWSRGYQFNDYAHAESGASARLANGERAFLRGGNEREDWSETLLPAQSTPGPGLVGSDAPSSFYPCDGCRQGDRLRLRSLSAFGAGLYTDASNSSHVFQGEPGTEEFHLFRGDTEVPAQSDDLGLPYFALPEDEATYRLTDTFTDGFTGPHTGSRVDTTWTFRSGRPTSDNVDLPHVCIDTVLFGDENPCTYQPLVYLSYHFGLSPQDSAPAGRRYTFTVTAQDGVPEATATLAGLKVWISPDGGKTWTRAVTTPGPGRTWRVSVTNPARSASPTGTVTVRAQAWDAAGNSVEQTIHDAYVLR